MRPWKLHRLQTGRLKNKNKIKMSPGNIDIAQACLRGSGSALVARLLEAGFGLLLSSTS
jgi:hypothetical protein